MTRIVNELHHLPGHPDGFLCIVRNPQQYEHIRPTHHAKADFSISVSHRGDLRQGVLVYFHHVIEKMNRPMDDVFES